MCWITTTTKDQLTCAESKASSRQHYLMEEKRQRRGLEPHTCLFIISSYMSIPQIYILKIHFIMSIRL